MFPAPPVIAPPAIVIEVNKINGDINDYLIYGGRVIHRSGHFKDLKKVLEDNNFKYEFKSYADNPDPPTLVIKAKFPFEDLNEYHEALKKIAKHHSVLKISPHK